ncbi:NAD-dependent epimerase/dehydratase family protein [bacterium]|nr:MAG: NAD-dependent epimerase/dehydratase family protein [bacterium]
MITGGAGYLATNLIVQLRETDCHISRIGRPGGKFVPFVGKFTLHDIEADVRERVVWESLLDDVDIVFHFAAQTSVYVAEQDPLADLAVNVMPMLHLLETCREKKLNPVVLFSGTVTEVGLTEHLPVNEDCSDRPVTVYDLHKWMAENYLKHYTCNGVTRGVILRLANVYGPGPKSSSADRGVLNMMIRKAILGQALTVYGEGKYLRDYVYVEDAALAFLNAVANIDSVSGKHFVIGSGEGHTILQAINLVAERVAKKTGNHVPVVNIEPPSLLSPIESRHFVADSHQYTKLTGWRAKWSLIEGIDATIQEFTARENNHR